ncbi:hypothetical protein L2E82_15807 [Cichorium intybus]|uniref:Uncharacterized protein n=1 Tax=Cichorium intybus TaxID=13427 RepID=A0ACB9F3E3_CICIN|nr:hypothetical protein L2E82_15807 [Cichorium intybus]
MYLLPPLTSHRTTVAAADSVVTFFFQQHRQYQQQGYYIISICLVISPSSCISFSLTPSLCARNRCPSYRIAWPELGCPITLDVIASLKHRHYSTTVPINKQS